MRTIKGRVKKNYNGWLIVNSLSGLSTRIKTNSIQQIKITANEIKICAEKEWTVIRRYNSAAIKQRFEEANRWFHELWSMSDIYYGKGTKNRRVKEAVELDQNWLRILGEGGELPKGKQINIWIEPLSNEFNWLKEKDFDHVQQLLESLSDKFALDVKGEN